MKKIFILFAMIALAGAGYFLYYQTQDSSSKTADWQTAEVTRRDIGSTVFALGVIKPMVGAEVKVGSRISGVVNRLWANIGDSVQKGDLIAELDDSELKTRLLLAQASLDRIIVDYEQARKIYERQLQLFRNGHISQQEIDLAESSLQSLKAQKQQADANVELARIQLSYATIRSPISGVIASVSTQEGETVAAGLAAPTFVNIINLNRLEVHTYVDETDIGRIETGQRALFTVDTYPGIEFPGEVTAIYPKAVLEDNVVNYIVTVEIQDFKGHTLRPDMTANVTITLQERNNVLTVPTAAIQRIRGERYVMIPENGKQSQKQVVTGWRDGSYTEILEGLNEGDQVLISDIF